MHALGKKNDEINVPQKIVSRVLIYVLKSFPCQRQRADRLFERSVPVHNAKCIDCVIGSFINALFAVGTSDKAGRADARI